MILEACKFMRLTVLGSSLTCRLLATQDMVHGALRSLSTLAPKTVAPHDHHDPATTTAISILGTSACHAYNVLEPL